MTYKGRVKGGVVVLEGPSRPAEGTEVRVQEVSVETPALTPGQAQAELGAWGAVYAGLTGEDVAEIERVALDRSRFFPDREGAR